MELKDLIAVGKVNKPHGVRGLLKVQFNFPLFSFKDLPFKSVFIGKGSKPLPYFVSSFEELGDGQCLIGLEDVDGPEKALLLGSKEIFLPSGIVEKVFDIEESGEYMGLEGFTLYDQHEHEIGLIEEVLEMPGQELARLTWNGQEVLIPLNEDQVIHIDEEQLTIQVFIPEGLLDLNSK